MKVVDHLYSTNIIDSLQHYQRHYLHDEAEMDEPNKDSRAISEMEQEYAGIPSTREDRCRGHYDDTSTYQAVLSPNLDGKDEMLEGSMAEVLLATEAAVLRVKNAGRDQLGLFILYRYEM